MTGSTVVLWRHGRTAYNAAARLQGQVDIPLDDVGRWQARQAAHALVVRYAPVRIVSSDLERAVGTGAALAELCGADIRTDSRLRERGFGEWEGLTAQEIAERWPEDYAVWRDGHDPRRGGAETRAAVAERMAEAIAEHAADLPEGMTLVVVSHGAAITLGLTSLLGLDPTSWRGLVGLHNAHWALLRSGMAEAVPPWRLEGLNLGPAIQVSEWNEGMTSAELPSSAADALRA